MSIVALILVMLLSPQLAQAVVYFCPVDGDGSETNPFMSRALTERLPGRGNIDHFRADVTQPGGVMLCESDVLPSNMTGVVVIGNERDRTLTDQQKSNVESVTKTTLRATTVEQAIREIVIPTLPRPSKGEYEIVLGRKRPIIKEESTLRSDIYYKGFAVAMREWGEAFIASMLDELQPVAYALTITTETFDCPDGGSIGTCVHEWVSKNVEDLSIASHQATRTGTVNYVDDYANVALSTVDHEFYATFVDAVLGGTNTTCSINARNTADAAHTYYRSVVRISSTGELNDIALVRTVSESSTTLDADTTDWVANDIIAIRAVGTTISARKNGVEIMSQTDGIISTGNYGGLRVFGDGSGSVCTFDNFNGRDIGTERKKVTPWVQ